MGNDGGSIPDRRDLVRSKPKAEQADKANQTRARWFFCALSKRKLQEPIVSCALGKLYNKDALLEYLLDKSAYGDGEKICGHIRSLKDVKTLKLTPNPAPLAPSSVNSSVERGQFVCPLTLKEMNGAQPFVYPSPCGCVVSHAGLKALFSTTGASSSTPPPKGSNSKSSSDDEKVNKDEDKAKTDVEDSGGTEKATQLELCPQCATKYNKSTDIIPLNPSSEEEEKLLEALLIRRRSEPTTSSKKSKKRKAGAETTEDAPSKKKPATSSTTQNQMPTVAGASRAIASSLAMEEAKRKAEMSDAVKSLYGTGKKERKETFMTMGTFTRYA